MTKVNMRYNLKKVKVLHKLKLSIILCVFLPIINIVYIAKTYVTWFGKSHRASKKEIGAIWAICTTALNIEGNLRKGDLKC